jgi:hypothetical protein
MSAKPFRFTLWSGVAICLPFALVHELEQALLLYRKQSPPSQRDLPTEIAGALSRVASATCPEIARAIRARTHDVRTVLITDDRFVRVPPPADRSTKAATWALAVSPCGLVRGARTSARGAEDDVS